MSSVFGSFVLLVRLVPFATSLFESRMSVPLQTHKCFVSTLYDKNVSADQGIWCKIRNKTRSHFFSIQTGNEIKFMAFYSDNDWLSRHEIAIIDEFR